MRATVLSHHVIPVVRLGLAFDVSWLLFLSTSANARSDHHQRPTLLWPVQRHLLADGEGLHKPLLEHDSVLRADSLWSLYCWMRTDVALHAPTPSWPESEIRPEEYPRYSSAGRQ